MRIVIIGAGWGGQGVCKALAAASLPADTSITCIDGADHLSIGATWQFELEGRAAPVSLPLADSCAAPYLKRAAASTIDYGAKTVALEGGEVVGYDRLVLACGAVSDPSSVPGLAEHAIDLSAKGFAAPIEAFFEGLGAGKKKTVHVAVAKAPYKCPPLPFEVAFLVDAVARRRGVRDRVDIVVTYPVPWPFGGPKAKQAFAAAMDKKGIAYRPNTKLVSVAADGTRKTTTLASTAEGAEGPADGVTSDLLLAVYPHRAPDLIAPALLNAKGSVPVDFRTSRVTKGGVADVFCVGDACAAVLPSVGSPIPKAGEFAYKAGVAVGELLAAELGGAEAPLPTARSAQCVAESGDGGGIVVGPNFDAVFRDPDHGKPAFVIEPASATGKVAWIQKFLDTFAPGKAPTFAPAA